MAKLIYAAYFVKSIMEKLIAQAQVYYILGYGRDSSYYHDKKWVLGRVYLTDKRLIFKKMDRVSAVPYSEIVEISEKDKYPLISPPMGWSRGNIIEIKHYEYGDKRHILISLIAADFDVNTKLLAIMYRFVMGKKISESDDHCRVLMLLYLGIRDRKIMRFLLSLSPEEIEKITKDLKLKGYVMEDLSISSAGRKRVNELLSNL